MIRVKDIQKVALKYPEVEEATHFRLPAYKLPAYNWKNKAPKKLAKALGL